MYFVSLWSYAADFITVNSPDHLDYAGTLSSDGLKKRPHAAEAFGPPAEIAALSDAATEGPSLSADRKRLYFHKRVDGVFRIRRAAR